jgi:hypothetical protein
MKTLFVKPEDHTYYHHKELYDYLENVYGGNR